MKKARDNSKMASSPAQLKNSSDKLLLELIEFAQKSAHDKDLDVFEFRTKANDPDSEVDLGSRNSFVRPLRRTTTPL